MASENDVRQYHSPLREAQADQTRQHILETMVDMLAGGQRHQFSTRRLAKEAGVSERTVYRYFPDRSALLDGVGVHLSDEALEQKEASLQSLDDAAEFLSEVWAAFDTAPDVHRAALLLNPDPRDRTPAQRARSEVFIDLAASTFPGLDPDSQRSIGHLVRAMCSSHMWMLFRDEFNVSGSEAGQLIGWAVSSVLEEVRRTGHVGLGPDQFEERGV